MSPIVLYIFCLLIYGREATASTSTPSENYSKICPSKDSTVRTLDDGYRITYRCDSFPSTYDTQGTPDIDDADECGRICQKTEGCHGGVWSPVQQMCWTSTEKNPRLIPYERLIYFEHTEETVPHNDEAQQEQERCQLKLSGCQVEKDLCEKKAETSDTQLTACRDQISLADKVSESSAAQLAACEVQKEVLDKNVQANAAQLRTCETQKDVCDKTSGASSAQQAACEAQKAALEKQSEASHAQLATCQEQKGLCDQKFAGVTTQLTSCLTQKDLLDKRVATNSAQLSTCETQRGSWEAKSTELAGQVKACDAAKEVLDKKLGTNTAQLSACETQKVSCEARSGDLAAQVKTCEAAKETQKQECAKTAEGKIKPNLYTLRARHCNKYLDVKDGGKADGTKVHLWEKVTTLNQRYFVTHAGNEEYLIRNQGTATYMSAGASKGGDLTANNLPMDNKRIRWKFVPLDDGSGAYHIYSVAYPDELIDVSAEGTANGNRIMTWTNNNGKNQQFFLEAL
ncbi:hypothetical protein BO94DRAFT_589073 [Aspergillus sclerotioniger CBS 115572]|uniref:Ricin B lectin domain-containing protein n=1 Tax=Aspergillus sclerotioniger CBS 115572 TaxID=1450535 RepID=A0A317VLL7_9EURO|nr:hypothetical protein BO94DRAFT_589073 [Aspergillus sclerotioniger CBS 115572]PWY75263.1 hypothetical protein BO94DRAFT_589073 [Aspergillus sclerotioniger CBS 115572]